MPDHVDLRSDTVTRPTEEMYAAMRSAPLGDDVLGDDPTVQELEAESAARLGFEAAVFVPSGTMGNQICLATHCRPGDSAIFEEEAHMLFYEAGAPGVIAQVVTRTVPGHGGVMDPEEIERRVLKRSLHTPGSAVLCVENTHNRAGGRVVPLGHMRAYRELCDRHGLKLHLDGARVFNAAVALGVDVREVVAGTDSVNFCLSKGLGSPAGSVVAGSAAFVSEARRWRKRLGGGMRQAGILAACALVSLRSHVGKLAHDHARAKRLAGEIAALPGLRVALDAVETNFVMLETVPPAAAWAEALKDRDVLTMPFGPNRLRCVLHSDVDDAKLDRAIGAFRDVAAALG
jgi:threonine aldolase